MRDQTPRNLSTVDHLFLLAVRGLHGWAVAEQAEDLLAAFEEGGSDDAVFAACDSCNSHAVGLLYGALRETEVAVGEAAWDSSNAASVAEFVEEWLDERS